MEIFVRSVKMPGEIRYNDFSAWIFKASQSVLKSVEVDLREIVLESTNSSPIESKTLSK